jgi:outer membrane immunogenic protein
MPYLTGGLAVGEIRADQPGFAGVSETNVGWTVGGGIEAAIATNWTAKLEYLYVDLGDVTCPAGSCAVPTNVDFQAHVVRAGLNFRF